MLRDDVIDDDSNTPHVDSLCILTSLPRLRSTPLIQPSATPHWHSPPSFGILGLPTRLITLLFIHISESSWREIINQQASFDVNMVSLVFFFCDFHKSLRNIEVCQFDLLCFGVDQDVIWFQVSVADSVGVDV